jgi:hypothetical protein
VKTKISHRPDTGGQNANGNGNGNGHLDRDAAAAVVTETVRPAPDEVDLSEDGNGYGAAVATETIQTTATTEPPGIVDTLAAEPAEAKPGLPNGGIAAALIAAGLACALIGVVAVLGEASPAAKEFMTLFKPTGQLSGKTTFVSLVWIATWGVLHWGLKGREVNFKRAVRTTWGLVVVGLVGTFPPIYQHLGAWIAGA